MAKYFSMIMARIGLSTMKDKPTTLTNIGKYHTKDKTISLDQETSKIVSNQWFCNKSNQKIRHSQGDKQEVIVYRSKSVIFHHCPNH